MLANIKTLISTHLISKDHNSILQFADDCNNKSSCTHFNNIAVLEGLLFYPVFKSLWGLSKATKTETNLRQYKNYDYSKTMLSYLRK